MTSCRPQVPGLGSGDGLHHTCSVMTATVAWLIIVFGYGLPLLHVALSRRGGSWTPPPGTRCPLGPRVGWLVLVLLLGPFGWLMFLNGRLRRSGGDRQSNGSSTKDPA